MSPSTEHFASFDGTRLAIHQVGAGPCVILLHGLFSSAQMNWIKWGHADRLAEAGDDDDPDVAVRTDFSRENKPIGIRKALIEQDEVDRMGCQDRAERLGIGAGGGCRALEAHRGNR